MTTAGSRHLFTLNTFRNKTKLQRIVQKLLLLVKCSFGWIMTCPLTEKCGRHHEKSERKNAFGPEP